MNAWVFDIDGVIADPVTKIAHTDILKHLILILEKGDFVALNTGRSFSWTEEKILSPLLDLTENKNIFSNTFVVCEKGNVIARFQDNSFRKRVLDDPLPDALQEKMKSLASEFSDSMFYDASKESMITFEMHAGFDPQVFEGIVKELEEKVKNIINSPEYADMELRIDATHISLDIQYEDAGKHLGAERIEDFMLEHSIKPDVMYMLGDSPSDSEMAEELQEAYTVRFIYVGDEKKLNRNNLTCDVLFTKSKYTAGALEFLERES